MKEFIKESLRLKLEAKSARHTSSNTHQDKGLGDTKDIAYLGEREWDEEIEQAVEIYRKYHSIMGSTDKGKGLYEFAIYRKNGKFSLKSKENSVGTKREAGDVNKSYMYIKASKPDIDIPELRELMAPKIGKQPKKYVISATDIAYVKVLALMGNTIKDFIGGTLGYTTSDAEKLAAEKTPEEREYLKDKYDTRQIANATKKANKTNAIKKIEKYNLTPDQQIEIDTLENDLTKNIRFLNTAKGREKYSIDNNETPSQGIVDRIKELEKTIKVIKSKIQKINPNYGE